MTGGTVFVGSHTVAALVNRGHWVRILARAEDRVAAALSPHGIEASDVTVGDVTDIEAVSAALAGCDSVIHAANVLSFDPRRSEECLTVNERGTDIVLGEASRRGLDPIVHVSVFAALLPSSEPLTADSAVGSPTPAYSRSKAIAERVARRFQAEGVPVVIIYPGAIWGPHDPYLGESIGLARAALQGKLRLLNDGPLPITDVRDVAAAIAAVLSPGRGPRRYMVVGHNPSFRALIARLGAVAGRNLWSIPVPAGMALAAGRAADWARVRFGANPSLNFEGPWMVANGSRADSAATIKELDVEFRPLDTTLTDTLKWLYEAGHITGRQAGALAS